MKNGQRKPSDPGIIYGLIDPRNEDEIRYVGQTSRPLVKRLHEHRTVVSDTPKSHWVQKLKQVDVKPELKVLETTVVSDLNRSEKYWIRRLRNEGHRLLNLGDGGDVPPTYDPIVGAKISRSLKRQWDTGERVFKPLVPEERERVSGVVSKSLKGRVFATPEEYAQRGVKISSTVEDQWKAGHYDYRAKTGPKSEKEGRIYPEDYQNIIDLYEADHGVKEIATYYDVAHGSITNLLKKLGVYKEKADHTEEIIRLYQEGYSYTQIDKVLEIGEGTAKYQVKKAGLPTRTKTDYSSMTKEMVAEAHRREQEGEKRKDIAAEYNVTSHALGERIRRYKKSLEG